jgi:hypothetical protein
MAGFQVSTNGRFWVSPEVFRYWQSILPGSKRLLHGNGMFGDNTDVRPPQGAEVWRGGGFMMSGGSNNRPDPDTLRSVVLVIDGVLFEDGEFVGPNEMHLWEEVYYDREVKLGAAHIASEEKARGRSAAEIIAEVDRYTGPPLGPPQMLPPMARRGR